MSRTFENYICSVYSLGTSSVRGSLVQTKTLVYSSIPCAFWNRGNSGQYKSTQMAVQTDMNSYEVNLDSSYTNVDVGYILLISGLQYTVDSKILHYDSQGNLDNIQLLISITTNGNS